jgi:anaerobic glycerol-3-phosphate dehydrogenase
LGAALCDAMQRCAMSCGAVMMPEEIGAGVLELLFKVRLARDEVVEVNKLILVPPDLLALRSKRDYHDL